MKTMNAIKLALVIIAFATVSLGGEYEEAKARYDNLSKQVKQKEAKVNEMRKSNPSCIMGEDIKTIINLAKKYPTGSQKKYYSGQVTIVRPVFYCTKCKTNHNYTGSVDGLPPSAPCKVSAKQSWNRWVSHYENIEKTKKCNAKIDAMLDELSTIKENMLKARKDMEAAYSAKRKARVK